MKLWHFFRFIFPVIIFLIITCLLYLFACSFLSSHTKITVIDQNNREVPFLLESRCTLFSRENCFRDALKEEYPEYVVRFLSRDYLHQQVIISLAEKDRWCLVQTSEGVVALDSDFRAIKKVDSSYDVPALQISEAISLGTLISDKRIRSGCEFAHAGFSVRIDEDQLISETGHTKVVFPVEIRRDEVQEKLAILQKILQQYTIQNRRLESIDLRFSRPIIQ